MALWSELAGRGLAPGTRARSRDPGVAELARAMVALGTESQVLARIREHLEAGADHVCLQMLGEDFIEVPSGQWREFAPAIREL